MLRAMRTPRLRALFAGMLAVAVLAAGCTSDSDDSGDSGDDTATVPTSTGPTITLTRPSAPLRVEIAQLRGGVEASRRAALRAAITKPIASWLDGAFVDVEYPQTNFSGAFDSWTLRASLLGVRDRDTTTNAVLGPSLLALVADSQRARLFVFAEHGLTGGATARVALRFTGQRDDLSLVHAEVKGELYLTRRGGHWKIFGYDLTRVVEPR